MDFLKNQPIGIKISALVGLTLFFMLAQVTLSLIQISAMGADMRVMSLQDIKIIESLNIINGLKTKKSYHLDHLADLAKLITKGIPVVKKLKQEKEKFLQYGKMVNQEIKQCIEALENSYSKNNILQRRERILEIVIELRGIEKLHLDYLAQAERMLNLIAMSNFEQADLTRQKLENKDNQFQRAMNSLLERIDVFTKLSIAHSEKIEQRVIIGLLLLSFFIILTSLFLAVVISRSIVNPIILLTKSAAKIGRGQLDTKIEVSAKDEIGELGRAFNQMSQDLAATAKLTIAKEYLDNIFNSMVDSLIVIDLDLRILRVNPATLKLLGYPCEELIGKSIGMLFEIEKDLKGYGLDELIEKDFVRGAEKTLVAKSGSKIPVLLSGSVMRDTAGKNQGFICVAQDISQRLRDERAVRESEKRLAAIVNTAADGIVTINAQGTIEAFNLAAERLFGYRASEVIGNKVNCLMPTTEQHRHDGYLQDYLQTGKAKIIGTGRDVIGKRKDGTFFPIYIAISEVQLDDRRIFTAFVSDLSERKRAEAEILQANEKLTASNQALTETQSQLVQSAKLASVGEMATGLAHELNQPLAIISMHAELRLNEFKKVKQHQYEKMQGSFEMILKQVNRASIIINHLRTFGRESTFVSKSFNDINQLIKESFIMFEQQFQLQGIVLEKLLSDNLKPFYCNAIQIEQVLINLLINSRDAILALPEKIIPAEGALSAGGSVSAKGSLLAKGSIHSVQKPKKIIVRSFQSDDKLVVEVEDTGVGISALNLDKVFDPFYTSKEVGKGTGLGLSISYGIIKAHAGSLSVTSDEGKGTTFRIELCTTKPEMHGKN